MCFISFLYLWGGEYIFIFWVIWSQNVQGVIKDTLEYSFKMIYVLQKQHWICSPWDIFEGQRFGNAVSLYVNKMTNS